MECELYCNENQSFLDPIEIDKNGLIGYSQYWRAPHIVYNNFFDIPLRQNDSADVTDIHLHQNNSADITDIHLHQNNSADVTDVNLDVNMDDAAANVDNADDDNISKNFLPELRLFLEKNIHFRDTFLTELKLQYSESLFND
jgi:hypothetical protein